MKMQWDITDDIHFHHASFKTLFRCFETSENILRNHKFIIGLNSFSNHDLVLSYV